MGYDRPAAPAPLSEVEALCNSARFLYAEDALADPDQARAWLDSRGQAEAARALSGPELRELVQVREALRGHLQGRAEARGELSAHAAAVLHPPRWSPQGAVEIAPRDLSPVRVLIGRALAALATAELGAGAQRLKVCRSPQCRWVYYDRSKANSGIWCDMNICGTRHKMRAYRSRRRDG